MSAEDLADGEALRARLQSLVSDESSRSAAQGLVLAWHVTRALGTPCESLQDLARVRDKLPTASAEPRAQARELVEVIRYVGALACRLGTGVGDDELRQLCLVVARQCCASATKIQRHELWMEESTT